MLTNTKCFKLAQVLAERFRDPNDVDGSKKRTRINSIKSFDALDKFNKFDFEGAFAIFHQLNPNPLHVLGLYPDLIALEHYAFKYHVEIMPITKKELDKAIVVLVGYLWCVRNDLISKEKKGIAFLVGAFLVKSARLLQWLVFFLFFRQTTDLIAYVPLFTETDKTTQAKSGQCKLSAKGPPFIFNLFYVTYKTRRD